MEEINLSGLRTGCNEQPPQWNERGLCNVPRRTPVVLCEKMPEDIEGLVKELKSAVEEYERLVSETKTNIEKAEEARYAAEKVRAKAEELRIAAEEERAASEAARQSAYALIESTLNAAESDRIAAETLRQAAEALRQSTFETNEAARADAHASQMQSQATAHTTQMESQATAYTNAEANRNGAYQEAEEDRDEIFNRKEATRDAANEAALNCADALAALGPKLDKIKDDVYATFPVEETGKLGSLFLYRGSVTAASASLSLRYYTAIKNCNVIVNHTSTSTNDGAIFVVDSISSVVTGYEPANIIQQNNASGAVTNVSIPVTAGQSVVVGKHDSSSLSFAYTDGSTKLSLVESKVNRRTLIEDNVVMTNESHYINLNGLSVGDTCSKTLSYANGYGYKVIPCTDGDVFMLTTFNNSTNARVYAVLDKDDKVLAIAASSITSASNLIVNIPQGGTQIIVNSKTTAGTTVIKHQKQVSDVAKQNIVDIGLCQDELNKKVNVKYGGNLFDKMSPYNESDVLLSSGQIVEADYTVGGCVSHWIEVEPNTKYTTNYKMQSQSTSLLNIAIYNGSKSYSRNAYSNSEQDYVAGNIVSFTTSAEERYIRLSFLKEALPTIDGYIVNKGETATDPIHIDPVVHQSELEGGGIGGTNLSKYTLFVIGDSLSTPNTFQTEMVSKTGIQYDGSKNNHNVYRLSAGGTNSFGGELCGVIRTRNLVNSGWIEGDGSNVIVLFEQYNDTPQAFSQGQFYKDAPINTVEQVLESNDDYSTLASYLESVPSANRKIGTVLRMKKTTSYESKRLKITNLPSSEGVVTIRAAWAGNGNTFPINVTPQMSISDIYDAILAWDYGQIIDTWNSVEQSVDFSLSSNSAITLTFTDTGNTGMEVTIESFTGGVVNVQYWFIGTSASDWEDTTKWVTDSNFGWSSAMKSQIQLIQKNFPKAKIFWVYPPHLGAAANLYMDSNGYVDTDAYWDSIQTGHALAATLKAIELTKEACNYFGVHFLDAHSNSGMSPQNQVTYYGENNTVHPNATGYRHLGDWLVRQIISNLEL